MKNFYYLIPLIIILLFVIPLFIKVRLSYNVLKNIGAMSVFLFGLKIIVMQFNITRRGIYLYESGKEEFVDFNTQTNEAIITENLIKQIKDKVKLKILKLYYNLGVEDAFSTAMICGVINSAILTFFTRIKCSKPTASLFLGDNPSYNEKVFEVSLYLKFSISLFDLVYSFVNSVMLTIKDNKSI